MRRNRTEPAWLVVGELVHRPRKGAIPVAGEGTRAAVDRADRANAVPAVQLHTAISNEEELPVLKRNATRGKELVERNIKALKVPHRREAWKFRDQLAGPV